MFEGGDVLLSFAFAGGADADAGGGVLPAFVGGAGAGAGVDATLNTSTSGLCSDTSPLTSSLTVSGVGFSCGTFECGPTVQPGLFIYLLKKIISFNNLIY